MISIARDFSVAPGPRLIEEGEFSGEDFRNRILAPKYTEAIQANAKLVVNLDGTLGYGTSFLEEAFGGLVRIGNSPDEVKSRLEIISTEEPYLIEDITEYIEKAND